MNQSWPVPLDVKLMNFTATVLLVGCGVFMVTLAGWWLVRHPVFSIARISLQGEIHRLTVSEIRAGVMPQLRGNFFTLNLQQARAAFETPGWVRHASVQRVFPNQLRIQVEEQVPVAFWGDEGTQHMLNSYGEVFEADLSQLDLDDFPRLKGPEENSEEVLDMFTRLHNTLEAIELELDELELTGRGSWRGRLTTGAVIEFGSGSHQDVLMRTQRFVRTLPQASAYYGRRPALIEGADLRHGEGYALKLRGVTTVLNTLTRK